MLSDLFLYDNQNMSPNPDWKPTCSRETLQLRADMLAVARRFFAQRDYLEVETPLLSHDIVIDAHLEPFRFSDPAYGTLFLQTSPEAGMKRLLAAGSGSIFQITRSFRNGERGTRHNPEFTMIEWYGVNTTYRDQMQLTQELAQTLAQVCDSDKPSTWWSKDFAQTTYDDAFQQSIGQSVLDLTVTELTATARRLNLIEADDQGIQRDDLLNLILSECIEPNLGNSGPEFLCNYPLSQAALAMQNPEDSRTACRFELYARGLELCNGYEELTDAMELQRRDVEQNTTRQTHGSKTLPGAAHMMSAMTAGLPSCSGVALGFDRLVMAITGAASISDVIPFPIDRA